MAGVGGVTTQTLSKQDVLDLIEANRAKLRALGVRRLGLFGSFARGVQGIGSDVDMLVEFEPGQKTYDNFINVAELLEGFLHRSVDLLTPESLSPHFGPRILDETEYARVA